MADAHDEGRLLSGRYRLRSELGHGGMGTVWRAYDELLDRDVAVKELVVPSSPPEHREILIERTMREARIAARLHHPNIAAVHDVVLADDRPWIVMQLVPSRSLAEEVYDRGPLAVPTVARIGLEVLAGLRAAHAAGVLHRDVKPANILLTADGHAVLTDFGLATRLDDDSAGLTQQGVVMGTPAYLAPERAAGGRATALSDVWSLGATLYTAVEGRAPFAQGGSRADTLNAVLTRDPAPFEHAGELEPVLSAMLVKDPAERADAARVHEMLTEVARRAGRARTRPLPAAGPSRASRMHALLTARWREAAVAVALVATAAATVGLHTSSAPRPRAQPMPTPAETGPTGDLRSSPSAEPRRTGAAVEETTRKQTRARTSSRTSAPDSTRTSAPENTRASTRTTAPDSTRTSAPVRSQRAVSDASGEETPRRRTRTPGHSQPRGKAKGHYK